MLNKQAVVNVKKRRILFMKLMEHRHCIFALIGFFLIYPCSARNTYFGRLISSETIEQFIKPLPEDAQLVVTWIEEHADELSYLATTPDPLAAWADKKFYGNKLLTKRGAPNQGNNNFVFKVPHTNYWIKISGPLRRLVNIYVYNTGRNPFMPSEYKLHKEFSNATLLNSFNKVPTYQTISRFANFLRCQEVIEKYAINKVYVPEMYLVHIPGTPYDIADDNYIIVEKEVMHIENICTIKHSKRPLTETCIKQLYYLITQGGIFDFNGENLQIDTSGNLVFIDLEQGIVENPSDFYNKDKDIYDFYVYHGIKSFMETHIENDSNEYNFLKSLVIKDSMLKKTEYWQNYQQLFDIQKDLPKAANDKSAPTSLAASLSEYAVTSAQLGHYG